MNNTYPCIKVNDIETTISWYADFLGFQCSYKSSIKQPDYAIIEKQDLKIYICHDKSREAYASNIVIVEVPDINVEYKALDDAGMIIVQRIGKGGFSDNEFAFKDYEDNRIIFIQKA